MRFSFADCSMDTETLSLTRSGRPVAVEPQVFDLIRLLAENAGRVVSRDEIVDAVWGGRIVSDSAISARIAAARKAVGDDGKAQRVIRTVARRGLQMAAGVRAEGDAAARPAPAAGPLRIRYLSNDLGQSLAYAVVGSGKPVVRIGHNMSHLGLEWADPTERQVIDEMSRHFTVLMSDAAGTGLSDHAIDSLDFARAADDIIRLADAAGIDRFAAFSESGGCLTGLNLAARHPDRVRRLAMTGAYARGRSRRGSDAPDGLRQLIAENWDNAATSFAEALMFTYFPEGPLDAVRRCAENVRQAAPAENALKIRDAINNADLTGLLHRVRCPVMLIHGRNDRVHPLSEARFLAAHLSDCALIALETANHIPLPGNPVHPAYMEALLDFLARDDGAS